MPRGYYPRPSARDRFWRKVRRGSRYVCWPFVGGARHKNYGTFWLNGKKERAHRVAWIFTRGPIPRDKVVRHFLCDNEPCCNPWHLKPGTQAENIADKMRRGRQARGERTGGAKLRARDVRLIRRLYVRYSQKNGCGALARRFGLDKSTIHAIVRRENWRHVA